MKREKEAAASADEAQHALQSDPPTPTAPPTDVDDQTYESPLKKLKKKHQPASTTNPHDDRRDLRFHLLERREQPGRALKRADLRAPSLGERRHRSRRRPRREPDGVPFPPPVPWGGAGAGADRATAAVMSQGYQDAQKQDAMQTNQYLITTSLYEVELANPRLPEQGSVIMFTPTKMRVYRNCVQVDTKLQNITVVTKPLNP